MDKTIYKKEVYDEETGSIKDVVLLSAPPANGGNGGNGIYYSEGNANVRLKNAGSTIHPSGMQEFRFTYERIGRRVFLDGRVRFGPSPPFDTGVGVDEFWLDVIGPAEIKPDFTAGSIESVGSCHGDGGGIFTGNAYWSTNVGSGKDGIRLTVLDRHVSKTYPTDWKGSDHWRIHLSWTVP